MFDIRRLVAGNMCTPYGSGCARIKKIWWFWGFELSRSVESQNAARAKRVIADWRWSDISGATAYVSDILERRREGAILENCIASSRHRGTIFLGKGFMYIRTLISWRTSHLEFSSCQPHFNTSSPFHHWDLMIMILPSSLLSSYALAYCVHKPWFQQVYP